MESMRVFVRIRPGDASKKSTVVTTGDAANNEVHVPSGSGGPFRFDRVFPPECSQQEVFGQVAPLLERSLQGYNATVFAYGQTNSGKTHSMLGPDGTLSLSPLDMGVVPRAAKLVFARIAEAGQRGGGLVQHQVRCSYVEIYNGRLFDLLSTRAARRPLAVRNEVAGQGGAVNVVGAHQSVVDCTEAVMRVLQTGSRQRATASTDMNAHSSRSHAVFVLYIERRERKAPGSREFTRTVSRVNLVDLAGSEDVSRSKVEGQQFQEAAAINTGLMQLHRVMEALTSGASFVPYRDSLLTRVLQDSLGGTAQAALIAHVSPLQCDLDETCSTLRYATKARGVQNAAKRNVAECVEELPPGCVDGDYPDPDPSMLRRCVFLRTASYGRVFARVSGDPQGRLVLLVHGSGPENSSIWWNELVKQMQTDEKGGGLRHKLPHSLFFVQIDCPGYGRSPGDKQTIRSYPGAFLQECVAACGKHSAYCLVGSSQGCASVFNAAVELPTIASFLAVMDPVTHDPARFAAIRQPALLCYDTDDDGHPVSVGRVVRTKLAAERCHYFEFSNREQPMWLAAHFAEEMLAMFHTHDKLAAPGSGIPAPRDPTLPGTMEPAGGVLAWLTPVNREWTHPPWPGVGGGQSGDSEAQAIQAACERRGVSEQQDLFAEEPDEQESEEDEEARAARLQQEAAQTDCHMCAKTVADNGGPLRLEKCRHLLCGRCASWTLGVNADSCPVGGCGAVVAAGTAKVARPLAPGGEVHVVLEFGNSAKRVDQLGRHDVTAFLRQAKGAAKRVLHTVAFNINPQFPKSAVRVTSAPFELQRVMASRFPCDMLVSWSPELGWPALNITYTIQHDAPLFTRRLLVRVGGPGGPTSSKEGRGRHAKLPTVEYKWDGRDETQHTLSWVAL